ncbi:YeiH family protein [Streptomyces zagrosensis]|uniref:YeiH family protein n=1 Tax=Streptomyces zagrosensis TaxID=1042984 RepID=UPI001C8708EE
MRTAVPPPPSEVARSSSPAGDKPPPKVALSGKANGLALAVLGVAVAWLAHHLAPAVPMLTIAVVLGIVAAHLPGLRTLVRGSCRAGLSYAGKRLMRLGIVLLGLKLSLDDVLDLGWATVGMVFAVVAATFFGTLWLGRKLGLNGDQPLLIATGYSICGASAIGAVSEASESDERDVATSVALVTLCGTLAIVVLPLLQHPLGLSDAEFGRWAGASVHDVGQVVATAQTAGSGALSDAVLVKLMRVAMLAPLVAAVALSVRARSRSRTAPREAGVDATSTASANQAGTAAGATDATDAAAPAARPSAGPGARRPPLVPLFVLGFLAMVALRSTGWLSGGAIDTADHAQELLLAAALFGLGSAVHLPSLARTGGRVAALGLCSWLVIAGASYAGVLLTT